MTKIPKIGIACVLIQNGKILLGQRKSSHGAGSWACPGGHLEYGETLLEGAKRELLEETGLCAHSLEIASWGEVLTEQFHSVTFFVSITSFSGELCLMEPDRCEKWDWFDLNHLPAPLFATLTQFIQRQHGSNRS